MTNSKFILIDSIDVKNTLGEGVIWNHQSGAVWWTDIQECIIYRYHLASKTLSQWSTPERVGCMGFIENDSRLIVAFESGFAYFDCESGAVDYLAKPEAQVLGTRFNDGRVDRQGRFWSGTMVENADINTQLGSLYLLGRDNSAERKVSEVTISNGLCFSPDSQVMYHSDSPRREIYAYDFDANSGEISAGRVHIKTAKGCYPDGACVDSEGCLYSAQWGGSRVVRYSPEGQELEILPMPVSQASCVAFGGENLDLMFVTTAREDLSEKALSQQALAGSLLIYQTDFKGLEEPFFKL